MKITVFGTPGPQGSKVGHGADGRFKATHGLAGGKDPAYVAWKGIRRRCCDSESLDYKHYGGRGIRMFGPWIESPAAFSIYVSSTIGSRPGPEFSIDRIENDGDYAPGNIRWATRTEQQNNKRTNRVITLNGESKTLQQWAKARNLNHATIIYRLKRGIPVELALSSSDFRKANR